MATNSNIEWTDATWCVTTGCSDKSSGCANCYARTMSKRLAAMALADLAAGKDPGRKSAYSLAIRDDGRWSGIVTPVPEALCDPLGWKKPRRVFVNSMSDLFWGDEEDLADARRRGATDPQPVPFDFIDQVFAVMALCPQHTFQVLTKRPARMAEYFAQVEESEKWPDERASKGTVFESLEPRRDIGLWMTECYMQQLAEPYTIKPLPKDGWSPKGWSNCSAMHNWPLPNVWLGTSVENQEAADKRIPHLLKCPAAVRFLSCEPLLGPLDLWQNHLPTTGFRGRSHGQPNLHWVIDGGESGPGSREYRIEWSRSLQMQCRTAGVPYFRKQLGRLPTCNYYDNSFRDLVEGRGEDWPDPINWNIRDGQPPLQSRVVIPLSDSKGGDMAEWPEDLRVREMPAPAAVSP